MPRRRPPPPKPARRRRGDGSLSVAVDGTIRARLPARIDPKRTAREFRPGQMAEATAWLDSYLSPQPAPAIDTSAATLGDWSGSWWQTYVAPIMAPNTVRHYLYLLKQLGTLSETPLADIRPSMLQGAVAALSGHVGAATAHQAVGVWRACLEAAVDDGLIARNPARRLALPKTSPRSTRRHVTPAEIAEQWLETFEARLGSSALYAATAVTPITRKQAAVLLRRDGVGLQTHEGDATYLHGERRANRLNPESVRSARRNATEMIADITRKMAFEADMDAAYPEYAVTSR